MKIYLVRHGETDWNIERRYQGIENIPLNNKGITQAKVCGKALLKEKFDAVYTSPLSRAYDTAKLIVTEWNQTNVHVDERLIERDFGLVSGLLPEKRAEFMESGEDAKMEPFENLVKRVMEALEEYRQKYKDGQILVVTHGGVINAVAHELSHGEIGTGKTLIRNTCVTILDDQDGILKIEDYNKKLIE